MVFNLSGSKHIRESLKRFGVKTKECTEVLLAWFVKTTDDGAATGQEEGKWVSFLLA